MQGSQEAGELGAGERGSRGARERVRGGAEGLATFHHLPVQVGLDVGVEIGVIRHDVLAQVVRPGMLIASRKFHTLLHERIVILVHTPDGLTELCRKSVHRVLSGLVRGHDHVADLVLGLADDTAQLSRLLDLLNLVLDHELANLYDTVVPGRIEAKGVYDRKELVGKTIELASQCGK